MKNLSLNPSKIAAILLVLVFASCKTTKTVTKTERIKPLSANRLIKNVEENAFEYDGLDIKRINCVYETPDNKTSFRANLSSSSDDFIQVHISKLNLPVARFLLTPDSVKMVNYMEKNYFLGDYNYIENLLGAPIDFQVVQSIIANDVFSYQKAEREKDDKEFESYIEDGMYILQSVKNRKLEKISRKGKEDKVDRYLKKIDEENLVVQYLYIDPVTFKIRKIILDDVTDERKVTVDFDDFVAVDDQLYPGSIDIQFKSSDNDLKMKLRLSKFSIEKDATPNFKIPDKYEQTYF